MDELKEISAQVRQLAAMIANQQQQIEAQKQENLRLRAWLQKLAAVHGLEYSQDADDWRDKKLIDSLKKARNGVS